MKNHKQIQARQRAKMTKRAKRDKPHVRVDLSPRRAANWKDVAGDYIEELKNRWFILHGLNYLASDYATGSWTPVVDLYADDLKMEQIPSLQDVFVQICDKHYTAETDTWTPDGKLQAAWLMVVPETMRGIRMALLGHLSARDNVEGAADELVQPHHPKVWEFFNDQIRSRIVEQESTDGATPTPVLESEGNSPSGEGQEAPAEEVL